MSVTGPNATHHLKLANNEDASPTTELELIIAREITDDGEGELLWHESRVEPVRPAVARTTLISSPKDPLVDFVWSQDDWSGGALQPYARDAVPQYACADDVDLRWQGVAALGMSSLASTSLVINDGGLETGTTNSWGTVISGVTLSASMTSPRTGTYCLEIIDTSPAAGAVDANNVTGGADESSNADAFQSKEFTAIGYLRRSAGSDSGIRLALADNVGTTFQGQAAVTSSSFTYVSATRTMDGAATGWEVDLVPDTNSANSHTFYADDIAVIPTGGLLCVGMASDGTDLYAICGRAVLIYHTSLNFWRISYLHASATATSIVNYQGTIFVGYGTGQLIVYRAASSSSWSTVTSSGTDDQAIHLAVVRGDIWKSEDENTIRIATSVSNAQSSTWTTISGTGSSYDIGGTAAPITGLYPFQDGILAGKENGLWQYVRYQDGGIVLDEFQNQSQVWAINQHADNFSRGKEWYGWFYTIATLQSFIRYNGTEWQDMSGLLASPRLTDFTGRVRALDGDPHQLWLVTDTPTADATETKTVRLMSLRPDEFGNLIVHTLSNFQMSDVNEMVVHNGFIHVLGRSYNSDLSDYTGVAHRWKLPTNTLAPFKDSDAGNIPTVGDFDTSIWHGGAIAEPKAFLSLTVWHSNNLDAEHTIVVDFGLDGAAPTTTNLGTLNSSGRISRLYFNTISTPETNAIGRTIQLNFEFHTDDTISPEMYGFELHSVLRPERVRQWVADVWLGKGVLSRKGQPAYPDVTKATQISRLDTLELQTYPST